MKAEQSNRNYQLTVSDDSEYFILPLTQVKSDRIRLNLICGIISNTLHDV